jgi:hypothetical protein
MFLMMGGIEEINQSISLLFLFTKIQAFVDISFWE